MSKKQEATEQEATNVMIVFIIIFLITCFVSAYILIITLTPPVELRINLQDNQLIQEKGGVLFYKITNNKKVYLEDVLVSSFVLEEKESSLAYNLIEVIKPKDIYYGNYIINTQNLSKGKHTIITQISYTYKERFKSAELHLNFEVFE